MKLYDDIDIKDRKIVLKEIELPAGYIETLEAWNSLDPASLSGVDLLALFERDEDWLRYEGSGDCWSIWWTDGADLAWRSHIDVSLDDEEGHVMAICFGWDEMVGFVFYELDLYERVDDNKELVMTAFEERIPADYEGGEIEGDYFLGGDVAAYIVRIKKAV